MCVNFPSQVANKIDFNLLKSIKSFLESNPQSRMEVVNRCSEEIRTINSNFC